MTYTVNQRHPRQLRGNEMYTFKTCEAKVGKISMDPQESKLTEVEKSLGIGITLYLR